MADSTSNSAVVSQSEEQALSPSSPVELQYPTINLRTSYESLLSNSTLSPKSVDNMTRSQNPAMEESWAALQPSDYLNEDDQQSDIVDTGSLVDLSSTHDTESILGDESSSEPDLDEEAESVIVNPQSFTQLEEDVPLDQSEVHEEDAMEDTIILQKSDVQPHDNTIDMEYTTFSSGHNQPVSLASRLKEQFHMTVSTSLLDTKGKPFQVAYFGNIDDPSVKEELLSKIGAAIVLPLSSGKTVEESTSSLYNIIPTEFGPGSKPTFADLMPSHAQMSVEDVNFVSYNTDHLQIISKKGVVFDSAGTNSNEWRPDLLLVYIDRVATPEDSRSIEKIIAFTRANAWPTLIVTRHVSGDLCSQAPGSISRVREIKEQDMITTISQPIDLDSFIRIDTEQINRHLKFLTERSEAYRPDSMRFTSVQRLWKTVQEHVSPDTSDSYAAQLADDKRRYNASASEGYRRRQLEQDRLTVQGSVEQQEQLDNAVDTIRDPPTEAKPSILTQIKGWWATIASRQTLKDTILSFAVLLLGLYITWFSQGLAQSRVAGPQSNTSTSVRTSPTDLRSTATSMSITPELSSNIPSVDQDVMVYEPITFDQVWNRLTGKSHAAEDEKVEEPTRDQHPTAKDTSKSPGNKVAGETLKLTNGFTDMLNSSGSALHRLVGHLQAKLAHFEARMELKKEKQAQIEEMNQKILDFWAEIPQNLRLAHRHSNERYQQLVRKSEKHIRRAKWATDKRLEDLIKEQKKLLSRAQHQAQLLTRDMPRRKRGGIFKKGGLKYGQFWR